MKTCTFFGHANANADLRFKLTSTIIDLIENKYVDTFYVGVEGNFDKLSYAVLKDLKKIYMDIRVYRVLAYLPTHNKNFEDSILPENIEIVPKRFAIVYRNKLMIKHSDYVITHVIKKFGGAYTFKELADKQRKTVINIE